MRSRWATVRSFWTFPVFSVDVGSNRRTCASSSATGRCSTPRGAIRNSPSSSQTCRSRNSIRNRPFTTRKSSSSWSWWCQTNGPWNLTSHLLAVQIADDLRLPLLTKQRQFLGQVDLLHESFPPSLRALHVLPLRSHQVDGPGEGFPEAHRRRHRQVEREGHG